MAIRPLRLKGGLRTRMVFGGFVTRHCPVKSLSCVFGGFTQVRTYGSRAEIFRRICALLRVAPIKGRGFFKVGVGKLNGVFARPRAELAKH